MVASVLVVDDDASIRETVCEVLRELGVEAIGAANGAAALAHLTAAAELPKAIILDLMMPVMDGYEFRARQLADDSLRHIPVLVVTADTRSPRQAALQAKILRKPVRLEEIQNFVSALAG